MGVGKSTLADRLGVLLDRPVRDSDRDIEAAFGRSGAELAVEHGVPELHRLEAAMLLGALASPDPLVVSAAASVVEDPRCRDALHRCARTLVLTAPAETLVARAATSEHRRPVGAVEFEAQLDRRGPWFDELAIATIDATLAVDAVVDAALRALGAADG